MNKLIFLGTGSANSLERQMTSLCFVVGREAFLIDCGDGMGTMRQLVRANVAIRQVNALVLTHRHADHIAGVGHFLFVKLLDNPRGVVDVYGPMQAIESARLIAFQTHDFLRKSEQRIRFHELRVGNPVNILKNVTLTAADVTGPHKSETTVFAYKVSIGKRTVVFSADMPPNSNFDRFARGADMLVHECFSLSSEGRLTHERDHATAKDAGVAAAKADAKQLILTHLRPSSIIGDGSSLVTEARHYFSGPVRLAQDLMEVSL